MIYKCLQWARVFVPGKIFHLSLMFARKAWVYPGNPPTIQVLHSWPSPQTLDKLGKTKHFFMNIACKKLCNIGH